MNLKSGKNFIQGIDEDKLFTLNDPVLAAEIKEYMRAKSELEEILDDPGLSVAMSETALMTAKYSKGSDQEKERFVKDAMMETRRRRRIRKDVKEIKLELGKNDISDLSAEWVMEWHSKMQKQGGLSIASEERKKFISGSLKPAEKAEPGQAADEVSEPVIPLHVTGKAQTGKIRIMRFVSLSAAAVVGILMMIGALVPSSDPRKIYDAFYEPFNMKSSVERGTFAEENLKSSAINLYKAGEYQEATLLFSKAVADDPSADNFFGLGLSNLETGNLPEAIRNLDAAGKEPGQFTKEATWFLGLAYLRDGKMDDARKCFEYLSSSSSFYRKESEKILRRLR